MTCDCHLLRRGWAGTGRCRQAALDTAVAIQAEDTGCTGMVAVEVPPVSDTEYNLKVEIKTAGFAHRLCVWRGPSRALELGLQMSHLLPPTPAILHTWVRCPVTQSLYDPVSEACLCFCP